MQWLPTQIMCPSLDLHRLVTSTAHLFATPTILTVTVQTFSLPAERVATEMDLDCNPCTYTTKLTVHRDFILKRTTFSIYTYPLLWFELQSVTGLLSLSLALTNIIIIITTIPIKSVLNSQVCWYRFIPELGRCWIRTSADTSTILKYLVVFLRPFR